jgi:uncharacterized OsmC-like protein
MRFSTSNLAALRRGWKAFDRSSAILRFVSSKTVVVGEKNETSGGSPYVSKITINEKHKIQADEPLSVGGQDLGTSPYDLLLSALGSCTVMTLRMYADRKGLALTTVSVDLTHNKVHMKDCEECSSEESVKTLKSPIFDRIERNITLEGNLSHQERQRLLEIANKCPVHRTLEQGQVIVLSSLASK